MFNPKFNQLRFKLFLLDLSSGKQFVQRSESLEKLGFHKLIYFPIGHHTPVQPNRLANNKPRACSKLCLSFTKTWYSNEYSINYIKILVSLLISKYMEYFIYIGLQLLFGEINHVIFFSTLICSVMLL